MNDHAQQIERAFRFGFASGVAAAGTRIQLSPEQLSSFAQWHERLKEWRDASMPNPAEGWPDIDGGARHGEQTLYT